MYVVFSQGIKFLIENDLLKHTSDDIAQFLYKGEGLNKTAIGDYLGERSVGGKMHATSLCGCVRGRGGVCVCLSCLCFCVCCVVQKDVTSFLSKMSHFQITSFPLSGQAHPLSPPTPFSPQRPFPPNALFPPMALVPQQPLLDPHLDPQTSKQRR